MARSGLVEALASSEFGCASIWRSLAFGNCLDNLQNFVFVAFC